MPLLTVRHVHLGLHLQRLQNQIPSRPGFSHVFGPQSGHHPPADILRPTVDGEPDLPEDGGPGSRPESSRLAIHDPRAPMRWYFRYLL